MPDETRDVVEEASVGGEAAGKPRADLDALINRCVAQLKGKEGARGLIDQLEMVQINLPNLG